MNEDQIQKVIEVLNASGWREVMQPAYANRAKGALSALALSPDERKESRTEWKDMDDPQLRAIIRECEWMLGVWQNQVVVYHENRRRDELAREQNGDMVSPLIPATNS